MTANIALVAAMAANRVIGYQGEMPWHLPQELQHFKAITMGKPMVMGRRTYESIGRPLPGRHNIVISSQALDLPAEVTQVQSPEQALAAAGDVEEIMIIGGGQVYQAFLPMATRLYLTEIDSQPPGDTWFPPIDAQAWKKTLLREQSAEGLNTPAFKAYLLQKI